MTYTFKEEIIENYVISIEQEKFSSAFRVVACPMISENTAGYAETSILYPTMDKANKRFAYLKRKIKRDGYACSR